MAAAEPNFTIVEQACHLIALKNLCSQIALFISRTSFDNNCIQGNTLENVLTKSIIGQKKESKLELADEANFGVLFRKEMTSFHIFLFLVLTIKNKNTTNNAPSNGICNQLV